MPIYEYQCDDCGHRLEKLQKISDERLKDCPACEKPALNKLVSAAAFRLKGSGWYETDFKTGSKKNALHTSDSATSSKSGDSKADGSSKSSSSKGSSAKKSGADSAST